MKIILIGQKGLPAASGGVEKHVENLAIRLVKSGHEVSAYTRYNYTPKTLKEYQGINLIALPSLGTKHLDAISHTFLACLDLIFKRRVDVIHFHSIGPAVLIPLIKIFKPRTPVIFTFHCQDYYHQKWGSFARACLRLGEFIACHFSDQVIAVSQDLKKYLDTKYKINSLYIPNAAAPLTKVPAKAIVTKFNLQENSYFLTVSRLIRLKGLHYIIEAYQKLNTDKKLVIVGSGAQNDSYETELKALANNNPNIIFTGEQKGEILQELFSNAYAFIQASETEGASIALIEAMAYGNACLVSAISGNLELVGDFGFKFKVNDVLDLQKKLEYLNINPNLVAEAGAALLARANAKYNWDKISEEVLSVYKGALKPLNLTFVEQGGRVA